MVSILLALLAAATNAAASVLQRAANLREVQARRTGVTALVNLLRQPLWLAGISAVIVSFLLQAAALATGELAVVQPLLSLELPLTLLIASRVFHRRLDRRAWIDIGVMTGGIAVFLFAVQPAEAARARPSAAAWAWAIGTTAGLVALLAVLAVFARGPRRGALLGVASGVSFALTAVFMSAALAGGVSWALFTQWETYLVPVAGITAMVLLQLGLQASSLVAVQPGVTLSDPLIAVLLGALLFEEPIRAGGWIVPEVAGAAAVAWGAVRLSRSAAAHAEQDQSVPERGRRDAATGRPPVRSSRTDRG
jgi:drug/metabolite transporter (DMT)-like permease